MEEVKSPCSAQRAKRARKSQHPVVVVISKYWADIWRLPSSVRLSCG